MREKESLRIVYMGTPEFAVLPLKALVENNYNVVGVVTMPDKPAGRGHRIQESAVKQYAKSVNLPILQPEKLKAEEFLDELRTLKADLQIVVAFRMLPEVVWAMPELGTFNLHASLLPQYRGAAPINWAIINGEKETGVSTFFLKHEIDTGAIILQEKTPIFPTDDVETVHDRLMEIGAKAVIDTVNLILKGEDEAIPQEKIELKEELKAAPKIFRPTCRINWGQPAEKIWNFVRGLSPYPAAWSELYQEEKDKGLQFKVFKVSVTGKECSSEMPGTLKTDGKSFLLVASLDYWLSIEVAQLPGKKRLKIDDLLRGFWITDENFLK